MRDNAISFKYLICIVILIFYLQLAVLLRYLAFTLSKRLRLGSYVFYVKKLTINLFCLIISVSILCFIQLFNILKRKSKFYQISFYDNRA